MKWGYLTNRATLHDLYKVYYSEVIPSLIENYNHIAVTNYKRNYSVPKQTLLQRILAKLGLAVLLNEVPVDLNGKGIYVSY